MGNLIINKLFWLFRSSCTRPPLFPRPLPAQAVPLLEALHHGGAGGGGRQDRQVPRQARGAVRPHPHVHGEYPSASCLW